MRRIDRIGAIPQGKAACESDAIEYIRPATEPTVGELAVQLSQQEEMPETDAES